MYFRTILSSFLLTTSLAAPLLEERDSTLKFKIVTSNARMDFQDRETGEEPWSTRKVGLINAVSKQMGDEPVIYSFQELYKNQLNDVLNGFNGNHSGSWTYAGVGLTDGKEEGDYNAIIYDSDVWEMSNKTYKWLSNTPDTPSKTWGEGFIRGATMTLMKHKKTGKKINFIDTHFDHISAYAREKAAKLLGVWIDAIPNDYDTFMTGDFNTPSWSAPHRTLKKHLADAKDVAEDVVKNINTYTGFTPKLLAGVIDFIWVPLDTGEDNSTTAVKTYDVIDTKTEEGYRFSDHRPVVVSVEVY